MKKQILTLTMCLALTSTAALAAGTSTVAKTTPVKSTVSTPVKANLKATTSEVKPQLKPENPACQKPLSREEFKKQMEEKMAKERQAMYDALSLTDEQKAKAEANDLKTRNGVRPLMGKVRSEKAKLRKLEEQKACPCKIFAQKQEVKKAHNAVKSYLDNSKKDFEAILTPEQKVKFKKIDTERKAKMKEFKKHHKEHGPKGHGPKDFGPNGPGPDKMGPPPAGCPMGPKPPTEDGPPPPSPAKK